MTKDQITQEKETQNVEILEQNPEKLQLGDSSREQPKRKKKSPNCGTAGIPDFQEE
jgi:hypothetical protein